MLPEPSLGPTPVTHGVFSAVLLVCLKRIQPWQTVCRVPMSRRYDNSSRMLLYVVGQVASAGRWLLGSAASSAAAAASGSAPAPQQKVVPLEQQPQKQQELFEVRHRDPHNCVLRRSGMQKAVVVWTACRYLSVILACDPSFQSPSPGCFSRNDAG